MWFTVIQAVAGLPFGARVRKTGVTKNGLWMVEVSGTTYFVPPSCLWPEDQPLPFHIVWQPVQLSPLTTGWAPVMYVPWSAHLQLPADEVERRHPVARHTLNRLNTPGRILRIFATPQMLQEDLHRFILASEDFALTTGDQSLGEGIAAMKKLHYECEPHKQYVMEDMAAIDLGLSAVKEELWSSEFKTLVDGLFAYYNVLTASKKLQPADITAAKMLLVNACYPPTIPKGVLVLVTCKDAGGQGDIVNARNTKKLLVQLGCDNVHLVLANTAWEKALDLNPDEDVWLAGKPPSDKHHNKVKRITDWPEQKKSERVLVVHVAALLNTTFEKEIKCACTKGSYQNARTIQLLEYGYTCGAKYYKKRKMESTSMGFGAGEYGIHVLPEFFEQGKKGYGNAPERLARLDSVTGSVAKVIVSWLFGTKKAGKYAAEHRLYAGYSHGHGERFVKLVAHMERCLPPCKYVDIVVVGNEQRKQPPKALFPDLLSELGAGGGPDLTKLGFTDVYFYTFNPAQKTQIDFFKIHDALPEPEPQEEQISLREFFGALNPKMPCILGKVDESSLNRAVYERMGKWLSTKQAREQFRKLGYVICTYRDFRHLLGGYLCRESVSGNMQDENYYEQEMTLKGEEILSLEGAILGSETIDPEVLHKLVEATLEKFGQ